MANQIGRQKTDKPVFQILFLLQLAAINEEAV